MKNTKKKSAKERRVLIGALVVAGVITAGSTFAWFTSKDEVTNRLTASADYGTSVVEDFTPPENMTPGQEVEKDVSVVNTGNIDAFVKLALKNDLTLTTLTGKPMTTTVSGGNWTIELPNLEAGEAYETLNTPESVDNNTGEITANEVTTLQAGGILVFNGNEAVAVKDQFVCAGDMGDNDDDEDYAGAKQFTPTKTGLYLFKRSIGTSIEYSGYYYDATAQKYYALETKTGADLDSSNGSATESTVYVKGTVQLGTDEGVNKDVVTSISGIKVLANKTTSNVETTYTLGKLAENATTKAHEFTAVGNNATIDKDSVTHIKVTNGATNPVTFYIKLDDAWSDNWTYIAAPGNTAADGTIDYFYYNDTLKSGKTSAKLVDSIIMDNTVTQAAYKDLIYDMSVLMDSVQVTKDSEGDDLTASVADWDATPTAKNAAAITSDGVAEKINGLTWVAKN